MESLLDFFEFLYEAFGIGIIPIGLGFLIFLIIVLAILVRIIKVICKKLFTKPSAGAIKASRPHYTVKRSTAYTDPLEYYGESEQKPKKSVVKAVPTPIAKPVLEPEKAPVQKPVQKAQEILSPEILQLIENAKNGDVEAQCECGRLYMNGYIVEKDVDKAVYWYTRAAEQDSVEAHFRLGEYYADDYYVNEGEVRYFEEARHHLLIAAKENHETSQYSLAMLYNHKYTHYCNEKGYKTVEEREADPVYNDYVKKFRYWQNLFYTYNGLFNKEYNKDEQNFIE